MTERPTIKETYGMYINGSWVKSQSGETFESINPANKTALANIQSGNAADVEVAVAAANAAKESWANTSPTVRSNILLKIAQRIEDNLPRLAAIETMDNGKPIRETVNADFPLVVDMARYMGACIRAHEDTHSVINTEDGADLHSYNFSEPLGVVAAVVPWNFPSLMAMWKVAPALVTGNTIVIKLAETTSISFLEIVSLIEDLLPPGVLNVITGFGTEAGAPLFNHQDIDKLAFTGSTAVGQSVAEAAAKNLKPVTLELGGKSPVLVFPDATANMPKLIDNLAMAAWLNQSHICTCGSRHLIHEDVFDEVVGALVERAQSIVVGDPMSDETMLGAINSKAQYDKILGYLEYAKNSSDIKILTGGNAILTDKGYFIEPTIVVASNDSKLAQQEIFGPILVVIKFKDEADAIRIANDTDYGLGAGLFTNDALIMRRVTKQINAGRIWVNNYHNYPAHAPFGGYKQSGIGRETHKMMFGAYTQNKNLLVDYSDMPSGFYPG